MNINHTIISGNLTRPPEVRIVGEKSVAKFTIAHNSRFKKANGEQVEEVTFMDCEAWGRQGEIAGQYLSQGSLTIVEGSLKQDNWTDKEGQKRSKIVMNVTRVHLTGKPETATATAATDTPARAPAPQRPAAGGSLPVDDENAPPFARENWIGA